MSTIHPALAEHLRKRWTRPDAYHAKEAAEDESKQRAAAEQDEFEREVLALRHDFAKLKLEYELRRFQQKYSPNQPRVPAGSREGGQWTSDGGTDGGGMTEFSAAKKIPAIVKEFGKWTARQFVSRYCKGSINREMPGEFENVTIADIYDIAKGGDARARTCLKLLNAGRFRK